MFLFNKLFEDNPALIIPWLLAIIIAIVVHEFAHGFVAWKLGDDTAERMGRLTLNPLAHLDFFGSLMLLLVGFGWAKPVPINPANISKGKTGQFLVSVAGIATNIILAIFAILFLKFLLSLGIFTEVNFLVKFLAFLIYINLALFIFNLLPIAPLDGYRMFEAFAPRAFYKFAPFMERWGFFILVVIVFLPSNIIGNLIGIFIYIFSVVFNLPIFSLAFGLF